MNTATLTRIDEKQIHKTPRGEAIWPKLITPETKFNPAGVYEIRMKFPRADEAAFLPKMDALYELAIQNLQQREATTKPLPREIQPWKAGKDGRYEFRFKLKAGGVFNGESWENRPPKLFDSRGNLIENPDPEEFRFGPGTEVRTYFQVRPYFVQKAGITLRLRAVQILKFVPYDDAAFFGVEEENEPDGYVHGAKPSAAPVSESLSSIEPPAEALQDAEQRESPISDDDIPF